MGAAKVVQKLSQLEILNTTPLPVCYRIYLPWVIWSLLFLAGREIPYAYKLLILLFQEYEERYNQKLQNTEQLLERGVCRDCPMVDDSKFHYVIVADVLHESKMNDFDWISNINCTMVLDFNSDQKLWKKDQSTKGPQRKMFTLEEVKEVVFPDKILYIVGTCRGKIEETFWYTLLHCNT